jgi:hypothetical protein
MVSELIANIMFLPERKNAEKWQHNYRPVPVKPVALISAWMDTAARLPPCINYFIISYFSLLHSYPPPCPLLSMVVPHGTALPGFPDPL